MNYNESANVYTVIEVEDDMGGFTREKLLVAEIKCKVAPYTVRTVDSAGLPLTHSINKLFTQNKKFVDDIYSEYLIEYKGITYKKRSIMDAGKCLIIDIERIIGVMNEAEGDTP